MRRFAYGVVVLAVAVGCGTQKPIDPGLAKVTVEVQGMS
jgi:hypothetical protein